ncbi:MAG: helix-turn-helix domain-containing protein [bacterium]
MSANILKSILEELNLDSFSIQVYLKILEISEPTITKLATTLAVDRTKIYPALSVLVDLDLILPKEPYDRQITLQTPSRLIGLLRSREIKSKRLIEDLSPLLPELSAQFYSKKRQPFVKVYEGRTQFIDLFNSVLNEADQKDGIRIFGNADEFLDLVGFEYQREWSKQRIAKSITSKILSLPSSRLRSICLLNNMEFREIKWLPPEFNCQGFYYLFANKSIQWNPVLPKAIVIEDKIMNLTLKSNFDALWSLL